MDKFVPYEKLSKKKKRQLDAEKRGSWHGLKPITRKPKNPKAYDRKKARCWQDNSSNVLSSFQLFFNSPFYRPGSRYSSTSNSSIGFSVREAYAALPGPDKSCVILPHGGEEIRCASHLAYPQGTRGATLYGFAHAALTPPDTNC